MLLFHTRSLRAGCPLLRQHALRHFMLGACVAPASPCLSWAAAASRCAELLVVI